MAGYNTDSSAMKGAGRGGLIETEELHSIIESLLAVRDDANNLILKLQAENDALRATNQAARKELEQLQEFLEESSVWTKYSQQLWHRMDAILTTLKSGA